VCVTSLRRQSIDDQSACGTETRLSDYTNTNELKWLSADREYFTPVSALAPELIVRHAVVKQNYYDDAYNCCNVGGVKIARPDNAALDRTVVSEHV